MKKIWYILYLLFGYYLPETGHFPLANKLRIFFAGKLCRYIDKTANIERKVHINSEIELGKYSGIGVNAVVSGPLKIGDNVMMGRDCMFIARNHKNDLIDIPMLYQGFEDYKQIIIEDDVWIGNRVIVLPGVKISKGCIVGAGSVVTHSTKPYTVIAGNPAKTIRNRVI